MAGSKNLGCWELTAEVEPADIEKALRAPRTEANLGFIALHQICIIAIPNLQVRKHALQLDEAIKARFEVLDVSHKLSESNRVINSPRNDGVCADKPDEESYAALGGLRDLTLSDEFIPSGSYLDYDDAILNVKHPSRDRDMWFAYVSIPMWQNPEE